VSLDGVVEQAQGHLAVTFEYVLREADMIPVEEAGLYEVLVTEKERVAEKDRNNFRRGGGGRGYRGDEVEAWQDGGLKRSGRGGGDREGDGDGDRDGGREGTHNAPGADSFSFQEKESDSDHASSSDLSTSPDATSSVDVQSEVGVPASNRRETVLVTSSTGNSNIIAANSNKPLDLDAESAIPDLTTAVGIPTNSNRGHTHNTNRLRGRDSILRHDSIVPFERNSSSHANGNNTTHNTTNNTFNQALIPFSNHIGVDLGVDLHVNDVTAHGSDMFDLDAIENQSLQPSAQHRTQLHYHTEVTTGKRLLQLQEGSHSVQREDGYFRNMSCDILQEGSHSVHSEDGYARTNNKRRICHM
jgi:hypothetical protein